MEIFDYWFLSIFSIFVSFIVYLQGPILLSCCLVYFWCLSSSSSSSSDASVFKNVCGHVLASIWGWSIGVEWRVANGEYPRRGLRMQQFPMDKCTTTNVLDTPFFQPFSRIIWICLPFDEWAIGAAAKQQRGGRGNNYKSTPFVLHTTSIAKLHRVEWRCVVYVFIENF